MTWVLLKSQQFYSKRYDLSQNKRDRNKKIKNIAHHVTEKIGRSFTVSHMLACNRDIWTEIVPRMMKTFDKDYGKVNLRFME